MQGKSFSTLVVAEKAIVVDIIDARYSNTAKPLERSSIQRMEEAVGLARAIDLEICHTISLRLKTYLSATLIGTGQLENLKQDCSDYDIGIAIFNVSLSPIQQRNLEKSLGVKVIDRTGLILEIFGRRARTAEGKLQVDLARLEYDKSRLVRTWTHLERQRATGKTGGPGETQIELDRRMIANQIKSLKADLDEVRRTRALHRKARKLVPFPIVALVGYTNSGKSTLFNCLTDAKVLAKDLLFATLDNTTRQLRLSQGTTCLLTDTVGFISDLPHGLIAAFRATLEDVKEADVILHVRDISSEQSEFEKNDVAQVLKEIFDDDLNNIPIIEVWNKIDKLDDDQFISTYKNIENSDDLVAPVAVSALKGEGIIQLKHAIEKSLLRQNIRFKTTLALKDIEKIHQLYRYAKLIDTQYDEEGASIIIARCSQENLSKILSIGLEVDIIEAAHH